MLGGLQIINLQQDQKDFFGKNELFYSHGNQFSNSNSNNVHKPHPHPHPHPHPARSHNFHEVWKNMKQHNQTFQKQFPFCTILVTINSQENAEKLSNILLSDRLIACSNIIGKNDNQITSIYTYQNKLNLDSELLMILKTRTELFEAIQDVVCNNHPYEVPEIIALPIINGSETYLKWVFDNTKSKEEL